MIQILMSQHVISIRVIIPISNGVRSHDPNFSLGSKDPKLTFQGPICSTYLNNLIEEFYQLPIKLFTIRLVGPSVFQV